MSIFEWEWECIAMDFVVGLPPTISSFDSILVVVDQLTNSGQFISVKMKYIAERLAQFYISQIVRVRGV